MTAHHLWTPPSRQGKTLGSLLRVVGCCHLSGLGCGTMTAAGLYGSSRHQGRIRRLRLRREAATNSPIVVSRATRVRALAARCAAPPGPDHAKRARRHRLPPPSTEPSVLVA